jgi:hypothetical protein
MTLDTETVSEKLVCTADDPWRLRVGYTSQYKPGQNFMKGEKATVTGFKTDLIFAFNDRVVWKNPCQGAQAVLNDLPSPTTRN